MTSYEPFRQLVESYSGLEFFGVAEQRLKKEVGRKSDELGLSLPEYFTLISQRSEALVDLVNQLTVNETYFYREPEQIRLFVRDLLPRLQQLAPNRPVRILSVGCSSGEEPYSLAMAITERWGKAMLERVQIDAGDLDENILDKARAGVYSPFSFRALDDALRDKYFQPGRKGYQIKDDIRRAVRFFSFNLKADVYPVEPHSYDAIFFRNVSIYFSLGTRQSIQRKLKGLMSEQAVLLLGSSETLGNDFGILQLVEEQGQYYFAQGRQLPSWAGHQPIVPASAPLVAPVPPELRPPAPATLPVSASCSMPAPDRPLRLEPAAELLQLKEQLADTAQHPSALLRLEKILQADAGNTRAQLMKAWVLLNRKEFNQARVLLEQVLEQMPWCLDALIALGLCQKWQGAPAEALESFKRARYAQPESWLAHYYLADIQKQLGRPAAARQSFQAVRRILSNHIQAPSACEWLPLALPAKDVLFLAERSLLALRKQPEPQAGGA